jgi:hypothetical protein
MRMMLQVTVPVDRGNELISSGAMGPLIQKILDQLKPEAAYFGPLNGERTAFLVVNVADAASIPATAEPLFQALNARVQFIPVMNAQDLAVGLAQAQKAG